MNKVENKKVSAQKALDNAWRLMLVLTVVVTASLLPVDAFATQFGTVLCKAVTWIQNDAAKAIATLAIIAVALGALLGKVSWGMAILVGVGVAGIMGAKYIATQLGVTGSC